MKKALRFLSIFLLIGVLGVSATGMTVQWTDNSWDETGFIVERAIDDSAFVEVYTSPANVTEYKDTDVENGKKYSYRIRAFISFPAGGYMYSDYSNTVSLVYDSSTPHNIVINVSTQN